MRFIAWEQLIWWTPKRQIKCLPYDTQTWASLTTGPVSNFGNSHTCTLCGSKRFYSLHFQLSLIVCLLTSPSYPGIHAAGLHNTTIMFIHVLASSDCDASTGCVILITLVIKHCWCIPTHSAVSTPGSVCVTMWPCLQLPRGHSEATGAN